MFSVEELKKLDLEYFDVVIAEDRDVTIRSKCHSAN